MASIVVVDGGINGGTQATGMLREEGHQVFELSNCSAALLELARLRPELVIINIHAYGDDGCKLCRDLKHDVTPAPAILAITGLADPKERERGAGAGADGFIAYPFDHHQLQLRVSELLAQRAGARNPPTRQPAAADSEVSHEPDHSRGRR